MSKITNKDINSLLVYVYSNERTSLLNNPFQENTERDNLEKTAYARLESIAKQIMERDSE